MEAILILIYISIYIGLFATTFYVLGFHGRKKTKTPKFTDEELPKVSILIPVWNEEKSVARTIESIFSSDYPEKKLEIILIDNNSKDNTLQIAKSLKQKYKKLKVYSEKQQGKGHALNLGIKKSTGDIFFSMDADTFVEPQCVKEMVRYFKNPKVMSVTPSMLIHNPKGVLQRIQQAEYLFGLFLRKAFASINSVYITPGAFSAYRKTFVEKYGAYDTENITEDMELSIRIQHKGYIIENSPDSPAYTIAPSTFKKLMIQRRRWYVGLMQNTWRYRSIISPKYGDLGLFTIPISWISIFFSVFIINFVAIKMFLNIRSEFLFLSKINFNFLSLFSLTKYTAEEVLFQILSTPVSIFILFFIIILAFYIKFATKKIGKSNGLALSIPLYFLLFSILFGIWWTVSIIYVALNKKVKWR